MEVIIFNITLICAVVIACNLLVFELIDEMNIVMLAAIIDLSVVIAMTFAYFYLSERITSDLLEIDDIFYDSPWYRLPIKRQKLLVLPIQRAGRELRMTGLGLFDCSLAVFSKVIFTFFFYSKTSSLSSFRAHSMLSDHRGRTIQGP